MKDHALLEAIRKEVQAGRVDRSSYGNVDVYKYSRDCQYKGLWNKVNRICRGIIFDREGNIIARPFPKFFNLFEIPESHPERLPWKEGYQAYEKLDGSCGIGFIDPATYSWRLATPGSSESKQAAQGTQILQSHYDAQLLPQGVTPVFEIIYPDNIRVVDYGNQPFLSLLAMFELNGEEWHPSRVDQIATRLGFHRPATVSIPKDDFFHPDDHKFPSNYEGYVVRFNNGYRVKFKSPWYNQINKLLDLMSPKQVIDMIVESNYGLITRHIPKHLQLRFDDVRSTLQGLYNSFYGRALDLYAAVPSGMSDKDTAMYILSNVSPEYCRLVLGVWRKKDISKYIWQKVLEHVKE